MKTDLTAAGYIFSGDKVLLIHHKKLDLWLGVGGHIEENETPDEALKREIMEETSLEIEILCRSTLPVEGNTRRHLANPFHVNVHSVGDHDHCCFYYVCKALNPEAIKANGELKGFKWFSAEGLKDELVPPDVRAQALEAFRIYGAMK